MSDSLRPHGLQPTRLLYPWDSPGNTGMGCRALLQEIFLTQGLNRHLLHWPADFLPLSNPLLLPPSIFPSIRVFSNESVLLIRWPKYWSFSISSSSEFSGLVSFRMDWLDLLAVQGTLKSLLHHCSSKASILWHSAFFMVQLSHPYMTTGKTIVLTIWTLVHKVMSLHFNMLSRLQSIGSQ